MSDIKVKITPLISEEDRRANIPEPAVSINPLSRKEELKKKVLADILKKIEDRDRAVQFNSSR